LSERKRIEVENEGDLKLLKREEASRGKEGRMKGGTW